MIGAAQMRFRFAPVGLLRRPRDPTGSGYVRISRLRNVIVKGTCVKNSKAPILLLLMLGITAGCAASGQTLHGNVYENPGQAPDFTLPSTTGTDFTLSGETGNLVLLYFGYTFCPDICPATLAQLRLVISDANVDPSQMRVVMITVDPARDTLPVLKEYLARFNPAFIGLRGEGTQLERVLAAYGVYAAIDPESDPENYLMTHTARVFLIDPNGQLVTNYSFDTPLEDIQQDIENLLRTR
jgi:protein SCO1/2